TLSSDGNTAYVVGVGGAGFQIIDITTPATPTLLGAYDDSFSNYYGVTISSDENTAYVVNLFNGFQIIDISTPASPTLLATYPTPGNSYGLTLSPDGTKAYVADRGNGLVIIDITTPASPTHLGTIPTPGVAIRVTLSSDGNTAYVSDSSSGLQIIDVTIPASPTLLGGLDTPGTASDVTLSSDGTTAYVADGTSGLQIIDITTPASPTFLGTRDTLGSATDVTLSSDGTTVYVADGIRGLQIIDITTPASPTLLGTRDTPGNATGVTLSSDEIKAYVADSYGGLQIIQLGTYPTDSPYITATTTQAFDSTVTSFTETLAIDNEGSVAYHVSTDAGTTWNYWDGAAWATSTQTDGTETSVATDINTNIATLDTDGGYFTWRAYLTSDGIQKVELDQVDVTYVETVLVEFDNVSYSGLESSGIISGNLLVSGGDTTLQAVDSVDVVLNGNTATAGTDFLVGPLTINIPASDYSTVQSIPFSITINDDSTVEVDETIDLSLLNFSANAKSGDANADATNQSISTATINDDDSLTVEFSSASASSIDESGDASNNPDNFPSLLIKGDTDVALSIDLDDLLSGSATSGVTDYSFSDPTTINLTPGSYDGLIGTSISLASLVTLVDDTLLESDESIDFGLSNPVGVTVGDADGDTITQSTHTYTITEDDIVDANLTVGTHGDEAGPTSIVYTVTLATVNNTGSAITFDSAFSGGSAIAGDYTDVSGAATISVADGASTGTLIVPVIDDALLEGTETLELTISNASDAAINIATASASANISDNDNTAGSVDADLTVSTEGDEAGPTSIVYTVTLATVNNTGSAITFDTAFSGGSAIAADYSDVSGAATISVADGASTGTLTVPV
ncbi:MAG: hypothetical protein GY696_00800, partial [Gammaproteobacteria bacterium]|nr:hypothetical protein [Gammaproteobacteria bacterium]